VLMCCVFILRVSCVVFPRCSGIVESPIRLTLVSHTNSVVLSASKKNAAEFAGLPRAQQSRAPRLSSEEAGAPFQVRMHVDWMVVVACGLRRRAADTTCRTCGTRVSHGGRGQKPLPPSRSWSRRRRARRSVISGGFAVYGGLLYSCGSCWCVLLVCVRRVICVWLFFPTPDTAPT
jgi:hypothetical protein